MQAPSRKATVARGQDGQQAAVDGGASLRFDDRAEAVDLGGGEPELDHGPGDVPGDVLAADEVVGGAVIEGIGLQQACRPP